ncbi:hypothetical protein [Microbispora sp. NPDC049125]
MTLQLPLGFDKDQLLHLKLEDAGLTDARNKQGWRRWTPARRRGRP